MCGIRNELVGLNFEKLEFAYAKASREMHLETQFIYWCNKDIYQIFKSCCITSVLLFTKKNLFYNLIYYIV